MRRSITAILLAGALLVPGIKAVSAGQQGPSPTVTYAVEPGDTLWAIAGRLSAGEDRRKVVHELIQLNGLASPTLLPGQRIQLPAR